MIPYTFKNEPPVGPPKLKSNEERFFAKVKQENSWIGKLNQILSSHHKLVFWIIYSFF